ncbi:type II toxin-antitoxin system VapC family toxin [Methylocystis sp. L43]|uniref:PIN domain-containing protein n=1 Tax=unclassified Methylocystis TaxID=2625913 RepID=UPI0018C23379|nr:type II toxin-antitoxin system VapC family toxin [Methylocystis sp. L43]MBG0805432.1 type II toxin-antitoxin system VapC family toxin [Methylocystis sp. H15]
MIALDTNVLVRYLAQDDREQAKAATRFIEEALTAGDPGFISAIVLCEIIWVLESRYDLKRTEVVSIIKALLDTRQIVIGEANAVRAALNHSSVDLVDAIIHEVGRSRQCQRTVTFDRKFARLAGVELLGR